MYPSAAAVQASTDPGPVTVLMLMVPVSSSSAAWLSWDPPLSWAEEESPPGAELSVPPQPARQLTASARHRTKHISFFILLPSCFL